MPSVKNVFGTWRPSVTVFQVTCAPTRTVYVPATVKLYSRNGSLVCVLPGSGVDAQAPVAELGSIVHVTVFRMAPFGPISWNTGCAVKPSVSLTWKYCFAHGKSATIHWYCGSTTGTWTLEVTLFALSMSMMPLTPLPPRVIDTENACV